jgi:hypothetical protein
LRPLDSAAALRLMKALAGAGDRASALQQADVHENLLRDQLDLEPGVQESAYAAQLRAPPARVAARWSSPLLLSFAPPLLKRLSPVEEEEVTPEHSPIADLVSDA